MYLIDQEIAREIAETQELLYPEMRELFKATEAKAERLEDKMRQELETSGETSQVARSLVAFLPLLLENRAITRYISQLRAYHLRGALPELLTAEETALRAQMEYRLDKEETLRLTRLMKDRQAASRSAPRKSS
jgi:hypothetical protein